MEGCGTYNIYLLDANRYVSNIIYQAQREMAPLVLLNDTVLCVCIYLLIK